MIFAEQGHINDLVEMADAVLLINSGVGITALTYEKPLLYAGTAFFGHDGLARQVHSHQDVIDAISPLTAFRPDREAIRQFLHYLVFEFYSFANFKTRRVRWKDGTWMTATQSIDYKVLRLPGVQEIRLEQRSSVEVPKASILFDRYRSAWVKAGAAQTSNAPGVEAKPSTVSAVSNASADGKIVPLNSRSRSPLTLRKLKKLRQNPVMFLRDSQYSVLKTLGYSISTH